MTVDKEKGSIRRRAKKSIKKVCSVKTVKKRLPIVSWLPKYSVVTLIQDIIAGITVGLTAIPQGIAYAVVAGLSPEYGLYSGLAGGFLYLIFGSSKDITIGPTAILSALTAKYVADYSADFAVLAAFLVGVVCLLMGILNLGFLMEFISANVIAGFTIAGAIQIASAQLRSLLGLDGPSGNYFAESFYYFIKNITTAKLWDSLLGFVTIGILVALKRLGQGCKRTDGLGKQLKWFISLARNAVVVLLGMIIAFTIKKTTDGEEPFQLIGDIGSGLPEIKLPPFSTVVKNESYEFQDMLRALGPQSIVLPLVAILESIAIAKAFAGGLQLDATQEMIALGLCNIGGSFLSSMPVTGSFTRTAINNASGVQTPAGGIFTGFLILLALSLLTTSFYYIPRASLAGLIIAAMFSMIDYKICCRLWKSSKVELFILILTITVSLSVGLEYGICLGIVVEALILLFKTARPNVAMYSLTTSKGDVLVLPLSGNVAFCAAEHIRREVMKAASKDVTLVIDGTEVRSMDTTVALNLMTAVKDLQETTCAIFILNFKPSIKEMCSDIYTKVEQYFVSAKNVEDFLNDVTFSTRTLSMIDNQKGTKS